MRSALLTADLLLAGRDDVLLWVRSSRLCCGPDVGGPGTCADARCCAVDNSAKRCACIAAWATCSIVLGVKPTRETEQLRESIHAAAPAGSVVSDAALPPAATHRPNRKEYRACLQRSEFRSEDRPGRKRSANRRRHQCPGQGTKDLAKGLRRSCGKVLATAPGTSPAVDPP